MSKEPQKKENISLKIVLLGNSGVGKTSLSTKWTSGNFARTNKPTIGANHQKKTMTIRDQEVDVFLWDTAGQEQFQALTPLYVRSAAAAVIVAAIDDQLSFNGLSTWVELLKSACGTLPPMVLAINKVDLEGREISTKDQLQSKYSDQFNGIFFVSASTGEQVDCLFVQAVTEALAFAKNGFQTIDESQSLESQPDNDGKCC